MTPQQKLEKTFPSSQQESCQHFISPSSTELYFPSFFNISERCRKKKKILHLFHLKNCPPSSPPEEKQAGSFDTGCRPERRAPTARRRLVLVKTHRVDRIRKRIRGGR